MIDYDLPIVKCKICDTHTNNDGTRLCNNCWEVTHRLENFVRTENGQKHVEKILTAAKTKKQTTLTYKEKIQRLADLVSKDTKNYLRNSLKITSEHQIAYSSKVNIKHGRKYTKIDLNDSGRYMVDKEGNIFGIKAYGVIHRGHRYGTLDTV